MIIVTSYQNSDLDGVGSMIGYAELLRAQGKNAIAALYGEPLAEARWVLDTFHIAKPKPTSAFDIAKNEIVLVDTSGGDPIDPAIQPERVIEIIDHRVSTSDKLKTFINAEIQVEIVGAAATLVTERFKHIKRHPSREAAITLLGGIISNTLNFSSSNTSERDRIMYEWLKPIANPPKTFIVGLFEAKTKLILQDIAWSILADAKELVVGDTMIFIGQLELLDVPKLLKKHITELNQVMRTVLVEKCPKYALLILNDVQWKTTDIFVYDAASEVFISGALNLNFQKKRAHLDHLFQRKQIIPLLTDALQK